MRRCETGVPKGSPLISIDGVDLAVDDQGAGQPVICLHAIAHGSADFDVFAARAAGRYRVVRIDWPGRDAREGTPKR
jgi:pimeloyl-ACP methyl ester carboxylesterase